MQNMEEENALQKRLYICPKNNIQYHIFHYRHWDLENNRKRLKEMIDIEDY